MSLEKQIKKVALRDVVNTLDAVLKSDWHAYRAPKGRYVQLWIDLERSEVIITDRDGEQMELSAIREQFITFPGGNVMRNRLRITLKREQ